MKVIKPIEFVSAMLTSSNAVETVADYVAGTTYAKDAEVNYANSIYVSLVASNIGNQPDISPSKWIRKSSNNKYSMFDEFVNTQTTKNLSLEVVIQPGELFNSVAFFNISNTNEIHIVVKDGPIGPVIFDQTFALDDTEIIDWYMYFYEPYNLKTEIVVQGIPPYATAVMYCTFTSAGTVGVGNCVFGNMYSLGSTQYGANAGIRDYSTKEANSFGVTSLVKRAFSKRMEATLFVPTGNIRQTRKLLEELRSTPAVWIGTDASVYDILTVFGYYRDFNIEINYPSFSLCRLEVEGLV